MAKSRSSRTSSEQGAGHADRVYSKLRELIVHGQLAPGARITETETARRLGVSRTPLRAALQRLHQEGYVVVSGNGWRLRLSVAPLTASDATELMRIIGKLEGLAAHNAAGLAAAERERLVANLTALNDRLARAAAGRAKTQLMFQLDLDFHEAIVAAAAGPRLLALHRGIKPQAERYGRFYATALIDAIQLSVDEHGVIIRALAAGDRDAAQHAMILNWRNAATRLSRVIEAAGETGSW